MKKTISSFMLGLCAIFLLISCTKDEEPITGTIVGFVSDYANANSAIAGATVTVNSKGLTKTTGSDGRFEFTDLDPGAYSIAASANNYQPTTKQVTVYAGQSANCDFQLEKASANVEISPMTLTFGQNVDQLSFSIKNNGNQAVNYSVSDVPEYIEVSPASGTAAAKSIQAVSVKIKNRDSITTARNGQLKVNIGNDSYIISISVDAYNEESVNVSIDPKTLTFDNNTELLTFAITSSHNKELNYKIESDLDILTVSPEKGMLAARGKVEVSVKVKERKKVTKDQTGVLTITVGSNTYVVSVNVPKYNETVNVDVQPQTLTFDKNTDRLSFKMANKNSIAHTYSISSDLDCLTMSPASGTLSASGSVEVSVSVKDRKSITSDRTGTITVTVGGSTYTVQVKVEKYDEAVNVVVQPQALTFDKNTDRLSFKVTSKNSIDFSYSISSNLSCLTMSPASGTLSANGSVEVSVSVKDRKSITSDRTGTITVIVGGSTYTIQVSVAKAEDDNGLVVPSGLYAYFTFENNTKDLTDTELLATGLGTSYVASYNGTQALSISGNASSMLSIPDGLIDQKEMSISFWVKDLYDGHVFHALSSNGNSNSNYKYTFVLAVENGLLKFVPDGYYVHYQFSSSPSFVHASLSGWHMITLVSDYSKTTYGITTTRLYVDGVYTDITTGNYGGSTYSGYERCTKFILGGSLDAPILNATRITIDNLRVYKNRCLSSDEIKTIYNSEK